MLENDLKNAPGVQILVLQLKCRIDQARTVYKAGYCTLEELLDAPDKDIRRLPNIGPQFMAQLARLRGDRGS